MYIYPHTHKIKYDDTRTVLSHEQSRHYIGLCVCFIQRIKHALYTAEDDAFRPIKTPTE